MLFGDKNNARLRLGGELTTDRWIEWQRLFWRDGGEIEGVTSDHGEYR